MKNYPLIKIAVFSAVLVTAMAFSCQDHHVPDPDPVPTCNRVDGSQRALPCEFEITRIEFFDWNTTKIGEVINPQRLQGGLIMANAAKVQPLSGHVDFVVTYNTKIYIKRIANSPSPGWNKYRVVQFKPANHPVHGDIIDFPVIWKNPVTATQEITSWEIGETKTFERNVLFETTRAENVDLYCSIINYNTWEMLVAAPYNYNLVRDISEATLKYKMQMRP